MGVCIEFQDVSYAYPLTKRQQQRSKRVAGFVEEYEKEGLGGHVIIKAADDALDDQLPSIDSEYRMGYNLTKGNSGGAEESDRVCGTERHDGLWHHGCPPGRKI